MNKIFYDSNLTELNEKGKEVPNPFTTGKVVDVVKRDDDPTLYFLNTITMRLSQDSYLMMTMMRPGGLQAAMK